MRIKQHRRIRLQKHEDPRVEGRRLTCQVLIAPGGTCRWQGPVTFTLDSGADQPTVPRRILKDWGLSDVPVIDTVTITLADGTEAKADVVLLNFRLVNGTANRDVLAQVEVLVVDDGDEALLGMSVLGLYNFEVVDGKLFIIGPNADAWDQLPDYEYGLTATLDRSAPVGQRWVEATRTNLRCTTMVRATHGVTLPGDQIRQKIEGSVKSEQPTEQRQPNPQQPLKNPKDPEPPKPKKPPGAVTPKSGAFIPPTPPTGPEKPL